MTIFTGRVPMEGPSGSVSFQTKGLALSGGGVRAVACGCMVALGDWLCDLGHLSAVSGGGFTGWFLQSLRENKRKGMTAVLRIMKGELSKRHNYLFGGSVPRACMLLLVLILSPTLLVLYEASYAAGVTLVLAALLPQGIKDCSTFSATTMMAGSGVLTMVTLSFWAVRKWQGLCFRTYRGTASFSGLRQVWKALGFIALLADYLFTVVLLLQSLLYKSTLEEDAASRLVVVLLAGKAMLYLFLFGKVAFLLLAFAVIIGSMLILLNSCETCFDLPGILKCIIHVMACIAAASDQVFTLIRQSAWHLVWASRIKSAFGLIPPSRKQDEPEFHSVATAHLCKTTLNDKTFHLVTIGQTSLRFFLQKDFLYQRQQLSASASDGYRMNFNH